jgi:hypothetical protein
MIKSFFYTIFFLASCRPDQSIGLFHGGSQDNSRGGAFIPSSNSTRDNSKNKVNKAELEAIGKQIRINETGSETGTTGLVIWNPKEGFPSLGAGHAIWMQKDNHKDRATFGSSFNQLLERFKQEGVVFPEFLEKLAPDYHCPWLTREAFENDPAIQKQKAEMAEMLLKNMWIQIMSIQERYFEAEEKYKNGLNADIIIPFIEEVKASSAGFYPLLDYVNFKGEGNDRPDASNWGLKAVLLHAAKQKTGSPGERMAEGCIERLVRLRIPSRGEYQWVEGWTKRCNTYKTFKKPQ